MNEMKEVFEYMVIKFEGDNVYYIADHLAKMLAFKGDYNVRGLATGVLVISGWTSRVQAEFIKQIELPRYKGLKMTIMGVDE